MDNLIIYNGSNSLGILALCKTVWPESFMWFGSDLDLIIFSNSSPSRLQFNVEIGDAVIINDGTPKAFRLGKEE